MKGRPFIDPERGGRLRWLLAAVVALLVAATIVFLLDVRRQAARARPLPPAQALLPPLLAGQPMPAPPILQRPASAAEPVGPADMEVCGEGVARNTRPDSPDWLARQTRLGDEAVEAARQALLARGDSRSKAVGLYLGEDWSGLARLAAGSNDATVYALAAQACSLEATRLATSDCGLVNAQRWTELDPRNMVPWLAAAQAASARGDTAGVAEAMFRASRASEGNGHLGVFSKSMLATLSPGAGPLERMSTAVAGIGRDSGFPLVGYAAVAQYCDAAGLQDSNRRQVCDDLAHLLVERDRSAFGFRLGTRLAERLAWPPERLDRLNDLWELYAHNVGSLAFDEDAPYGCKSVERVTAWASMLEDNGELGAFQRLAQRNGLDQRRLLAEARTRRLQAASRAVADPAASAAGP